MAYRHTMIQVLNLRGLKCPLPVLRTRKALRALHNGARMTVECTDPLAIVDIPNMLRETGDVLESSHRTDDSIIFNIRKSSGEEREP